MKQNELTVVLVDHPTVYNNFATVTTGGKETLLMEKEFKALKTKEEFNFTKPDKNLLEWFPNPGVTRVTLTNNEFTSLCPITGQPDYAQVVITYWPGERCLESKSLKLYCGSFRNYGTFAETLASQISEDLVYVLACVVSVVVSFSSRGGILISAERIIRV